MLITKAIRPLAWGYNISVQARKSLKHRTTLGMFNNTGRYLVTLADELVGKMLYSFLAMILA